MGDGRSGARGAGTPQRRALQPRRAPRRPGRPRGRLLTDDFVRLDATAQAELVRRGDVTPLELVDVAIDRIERLNPAINAVIHRRDEKTREEAAVASGPFRGVPIVFKDLGCHTAGDPYHAGMRLLRDLQWAEASDSPLATRFRTAGFVCVGRTNTPELGLMPTTEPESYGPTRNPWDRDYSSGGSSGGSAAAVASGMVAIAHAGDSGGSIRIPGSACGLVGLKPSRGRIRTGAADIGQLNVEHVITRTVRDTAAILDVLADGSLPSTEPGVGPGVLRIGLMTSAPGGLTPVHRDCVAAASDAATLLESLGHYVEPAYPAALDDVAHIIHFGAAIAADTVVQIEGWSARCGRPIGEQDVEPHTWAIAEMGRALGDANLRVTLEWLVAYSHRVIEWWANGFDLLLTPTLAEPPPMLGELVSTRAAPLAASFRAGVIVPFTPPFNTTGQPAISLPLYWNDTGVPIGVQLVAAPGREDVLIRVAAQLEQARPWADRRPPGPT